MIVKNVKVYREDQTFADGEIRILDGVFEKVCTGARKRGRNPGGKKDETVIDGDGAYAIPGLSTFIFTAVWEMISAMAPKRRSEGSQSMRRQLA